MKVIELIGRCLFGSAYWIRCRVSQTRAKTPSWSISNAVKLLFYLWQSLAHIAFSTFNYVYLCSFLLCLCGCSSTDLSLPDFFKKRKRFFARFFRQNHFLALIPCSFFHNVEKSTIFAEFSTVQKKIREPRQRLPSSNYSKSSSGLRFVP